MHKGKRIVCVIPARLKSTRFPKKMIAPLKGKPLVQWAWEAALRCAHFDRVVIALDSEETAAAVRSFGGEYLLTAESAPSGTHRIIELHDRLDADIFVNWQGDEPVLHSRMIDDLLQSCDQEGEEVWTLKKRLYDEEALHSAQIAKVVVDRGGYALYFSRAPIPHYRDPGEGERFFYKHIGVYAYSRTALKKIAGFSPCAIEEAEKLEQLGFLYHGLKVRVHETQYEAFGVDLPEHLSRAEALLERGEHAIAH